MLMIAFTVDHSIPDTLASISTPLGAGFHHHGLGYRHRHLSSAAIAVFELAALASANRLRLYFANGKGMDVATPACIRQLLKHAGGALTTYGLSEIGKGGASRESQDFGLGGGIEVSLPAR
jgi:hypothetical protein